MKGYTPPEDVLARKMREHQCPNCGLSGPHFIPPSFGDEGFYICNALKDADDLGKLSERLKHKYSLELNDG